MKIKNIYGTKASQPGISDRDMLLGASLVNGLALVLILVDIWMGPSVFNALHPYFFFPCLMGMLYLGNSGERSVARVVSTAALCMVLPFILAATRAGLADACLLVGSFLLLAAGMALLRKVGSATPPPWGSGPARLK